MNARRPVTGAGAQIKTSAGMTLPHRAPEGAAEALTQIFTRQGIGTSADIDTTAVPVPGAEYLRRRKLVNLILEDRPWLDARDMAGLRALYYTPKTGSTSVVKLLLERGVDVYVCNRNRCTALDVDWVFQTCQGGQGSE